jgi:pheromone a factor receptor
MHRLRKHRGVLSDTLSSTGSGLNARRLLKLFFLSGSILVVYLPVTIYFFYLNVDYPFTPYSWSRVHDPETWNQISFIATDMDPLIQFDGWVGIVMGCFLFILYGMNNEGKEIYRSWLLRCGFGRIFPRLLQSTELPMSSTGRLSRGSLTSRFDVVSRVTRYCDRTKKERLTPTSAM